MLESTKEGLILINKESQKTSFQIIAELRKIFKIKKIGHSGTLDKNADGLLVIAIGKSTKLVKYLVGLPKVYTAEIYFGIQTNTDDANGIEINKYSGYINIDKIKSIIPEFEGVINQIPPDYSAIHINGKRAYKVALSGNSPKLQERQVTISKIKFIEFNSPILKLEISCSSGTYIRSIARDLGIKTGYYAYLFSLTRDSIGDFDIKNAIATKDINAEKFFLISPSNALCHINALKLKKEFITQIKNGNKITKEWFDEIDINNLQDGLYRIVHENNLLAIIKINNGNFSYDLVY